jgi:hypothetical protein
LNDFLSCDEHMIGLAIDSVGKLRVIPFLSFTKKVFYYRD